MSAVSSAILWIFMIYKRHQSRIYTFHGLAALLWQQKQEDDEEEVKINKCDCDFKRFLLQSELFERRKKKWIEIKIKAKKLYLKSEIK